MALVQKTKANASSSTTLSATLSGVAAGNMLAIVVIGNSGATVISSVVDGSGNTVSPAVTYATTGSRAGVGIYYVQNTSAGAHAITVTWGAANNGEIFVAEYSGLLAASVLDVASAAPSFGSSTAAAATAITTTHNGDLVIFGVGCQGNTSTFSAFTNGFAEEDSATTTPDSVWADLTQATAGSISSGCTISASSGWGCALAAFKAAGGGSAPTLSSVNGGSAMAEGATNVPVVGTNLTNATLAITQPGGVSVAQTIGTAWGATGGNFNLVVEPGSGSQLAFTDATYTTNAVATTGGGSSTPLAVTVTPPAGLIFETLASINGTSSYRITAVPDLVIGDQLEASGNATGTAAIPTGLVLNSDGTWQFTSGNTPANFYVRAYDSTNKVWGAWALQSVVIPTTSILYKNVYEIAATGLVQWVHYIPIKYVTVAAKEVNRFDDNGAIGVNVLSSVAGLTAWVHYTPVAQSSGTHPWRYDPNGYIPVMRMN